jgi:hypothetical protein
MNNLCPGCQTAYSVQPQHVGRRITCKKCGAGLVVEADGLHMTSPPTPPAPPEENPLAAETPPLVEEAPARISKPRRSFNFTEFWQNSREALSTSGFGAGTFLVILFAFLPVIDQAKVTRAQARVREEGGIPGQKSVISPIGPSGKAEQPSKSKGLDIAERALEDAENSANSMHYWYDWGMLFGFLLLAGGSLGFLGSPNAQIKRVLGCIILASQLILVFIIMIGRNVASLR